MRIRMKMKMRRKIRLCKIRKRTNHVRKKIKKDTRATKNL